MHFGLLLFATGCSEYGFWAKKNDVSDPVEPDPPRADVSPPEEPEVCEGNVPADSTVETDQACTEANLEVPDPFTFSEEWRWEGLSSNPDIRRVVAPPAVAQVTDDNGDGVVDNLDDIDIVFVASEKAWGEAHLVVVDGATGVEHWSYPGVDWGSPVSVGDIDLDGAPEIVLFFGDVTMLRLAAISHEGQLEWDMGEEHEFYWINAPNPYITDVEGDGLPEVLVDTMVVDGATGAYIDAINAGWAPARSVATADMDLDGEPETCVANYCLSNFEDIELEVDSEGSLGMWSGFVQADGDPEAELALALPEGFFVADTDGTILAQDLVATNKNSPLCIADLDGDANSEVAYVRGWSGDDDKGIEPSAELVAYELDGTLMWSVDADDATGIAGCYAFDLDHDGKSEIIQGSENNLRVIDGTTGDVLFKYGAHGSPTLFEYPVVADVDGDQDAEIVFGTYFDDDGDLPGLTVLSHYGSGWSGSGKHWAQHQFSETDMGEDNEVPAIVPSSWDEGGALRTRPVDQTSSLANLGVSVTDVCADDCNLGTTAYITVALDNSGLRKTESDFDVTLYKVEDNGSWTALSTQTVKPVDVGVRTHVVFEIDALELKSAGLVARVDDDGAGGPDRVKECGEGNNIEIWAENVCD